MVFRKRDSQEEEEAKARWDIKKHIDQKRKNRRINRLWDAVKFSPGEPCSSRVRSTPNVVVRGLRDENDRPALLDGRAVRGDEERTCWARSCRPVRLGLLVVSVTRSWQFLVGARSGRTWLGWPFCASSFRLPRPRSPGRLSMSPTSLWMWSQMMSCGGSMALVER